MSDDEARIALVDLDGTVADYDASMRNHQRWLQAPDEVPYEGRYGVGLEPAHCERRRKFIQRLPGFWRDLKPLALGFEVVATLQDLKFEMHVLTKGPKSTPARGARRSSGARRICRTRS